MELGFAARDATETLLDTVRHVRAHFLGNDPPLDGRRGAPNVAGEAPEASPADLVG